VLAGHTYAFRDRSLGDALDELGRLGLSAVEVWLGHAADGEAAVARELELRRLSPVAVSAGGVYDRRSDAVPRAVELARTIGAPVVAAVILPELVAEAAAAAAGCVTLCLENHWDHPLSRPADVLHALRDHPHLAACLDTGHAIDAGVPAAELAAALGERLRHLHLKEARFPRPWQRAPPPRARSRLFGRPDRVVPGDGDLDVARLEEALVAAGYDGAVTLEYEGTAPSEALARLAELWRRNGRAEGSQAQSRIA
jgi:sugar phosphate isomerase/epimerase